MAGPAIAAPSSDAWAAMGSQAEQALATGWILDQAISSTGGLSTVAAPSTSTAFLSTGDGSTGSGNGFWAMGRLARVVHTGGTAYGRVSAAAYSTTALQTTVTLGTFLAGGTTSLSTTAITTAAAALAFFSTGATGNLPTLPLMAPTRFLGL